MFRRNLDEGEIQDFAALLTVLSSVFIADGQKDKRVWTVTIDGSFSVASFFLPLRGGVASDLSEFLLEEVWKSKAPPRLRVFAWLVISNAVLTMDNLCRRNIIILNCCSMCLRDAESVDHLFLHCHMASFLWS